LNKFWNRTDDGNEPGFATIEETSRRNIGHGEVIGLDGDAIHSVLNDGDHTTLSLHVYGMHLNHSGRSIFDPEANSEEKLIVKVQD
jgi:predicted metal-dependent enzyme (double-stranded beta helix superfamily)